MYDPKKDFLDHRETKILGCDFGSVDSFIQVTFE